MPRLSIVIPCLGQPADFDDTLVSVLQNRPARSEVLVVLNQPYSDPYGLSDEVQFISAKGKANLAALLNVGLEAAEGPIIHVLGCRLKAPEGWTDDVLDLFEKDDVAAVSPLIVSPAERQVTAAGVKFGLAGSRKVIGQGLESNNRRLSRLHVTGPTLEAGFYRRDVLRAIGGWSVTLGDDAADVDLAQSLAELNLRTVIATECHLQERFAAPRRGGFSHGRTMERLFWRQTAGKSRSLAVICHALGVGIDFLARLPKGDAVTTLVGRLVGFLHGGQTRGKGYRDMLQHARAALENELPNTLSLAAAREEQTAAPARRRAA